MLALSPDDTHQVVATKRGFKSFSQDVSFDGNGERQIDVMLGTDGAGSEAAAPPRSAAPSSVHIAANTKPRTVASALPLSSGCARRHLRPLGVATLDLNSTPRANVVVNGRPLGMTPLRGVHVDSGRQSIVFINPELGRKFASANIAPGGRASALA